jgi:peptidoglycan-associated lipoprotein
MKMKVAVAVLAVVGALAGCATTADPQSTDAVQPPTTVASQTLSATSTGVSGGSGTGQPLGTEGGSAATSENGRPDLKRSVYYEFDRYEVKPEYRALVESHARWLRTNPKARLTIEGNTDERGSREYNVALGQRRAESVTSIMVTMGVKPEQIEAVSFGKEKPRAEGHGESAWAENRRSDFAAR